MNAVILAGSDFVSENAEENNYIVETAKNISVMLLNATINAPNVYNFISKDFNSIHDEADSISYNTEILCNELISVLAKLPDNNTVSFKTSLKEF